jgi:DNA gyrase subunit A
VPLSLYRAQARGGKGRSGMATKEDDFVTRLLVANTHTTLLFFSSRGIVYKEKVWRLPIGSPQSRGKFLRNMLRLEEGDRITAILQLPDDWDQSEVMFATSGGRIRRNKLVDCVPHTSLGKRVMELDSEQQSIIDVQLCSNNNDVLLTTTLGQCIRFPVSDIRVFGGSGGTGTSKGNRGILLGNGDVCISMAILEHVDATPSERAAYLKRAVAERKAAGADEEDIALTNEEVGEEAELTDERYNFLKAHEQFVLTVTELGYGKRSSSYDFRLANRGGKGIRATDISKHNEIGALVAAFAVTDTDEIILVTDGGKVIRSAVHSPDPRRTIRIVSRTSKGVTIFDTAEGEKVVSVERIPEPQGEEEANGDGGTPSAEG